MALRLRTAMSWHGLALAEAIAPSALTAIHVGAPDLVFLVGDAAKDGGDKVLEKFALDPIASRVRVAILSDDIGLMNRDRSFARVIGVVPRSGSSDAIGRRVAELAKEARAMRESEGAPSPKVDTKLTEIDALKSVREEMNLSNTGEFMTLDPVAATRAPLEPEIASEKNLTWQDSAPTRVAPELAEKNVNPETPDSVTKEISIDDASFDDLPADSLPPPREETRSMESSAPLPPPPPVDPKRVAQRTLLGLSASPPPVAPAASNPMLPATPGGETRDATLLGMQNATNDRREPSRSVALPPEATRSVAKKTLLGLSDAPPARGIPAPPPWPPPAKMSEKPAVATSATSTLPGAGILGDVRIPDGTHRKDPTPPTPKEATQNSKPFATAAVADIAKPPSVSTRIETPAHALSPKDPQGAAQKKSSSSALVIGAVAIVAVVGIGFVIAKLSSSGSSVRSDDANPPSDVAATQPTPSATPEQEPAPLPPPAPPAPPTPPTPIVEAAAETPPPPPSPTPTPPTAAEEVPVVPAAGNLSGDELTARGDRALDARDYAAASQNYRQALQVDAGNPHAYEGLARVALRTGAREEALHFAQRAVQVRPRRGQYRVLLGDVYQAMGNAAEARRAWQEAVRVDPHNREARRRLR